VDYLKQPLSFKVKKVFRYLSMYGPKRTYMKILGQRHMRCQYEKLPQQLGGRKADQTVGVIGCGNYSFTTIAYFLTKGFGRVIASCMDTDLTRAASYARKYRVPFYTNNADDIIGDSEIRMIYIASNHATHAEYAIRALEHGKDVYIEKPHVVSMDQLHRLYAAMRKNDGKVFLGFNRPGSRLGSLIRTICADEKGAGVYNWFVAGHELGPDHWYFNPGEGGRVLGNLSHWIDFTLRLVPNDAFPLTITPTRFVKSDQDIAVNYLFADGTIGVITFSSKGQTFEGVRESFRAQKGNALIAMDDFKQLTVEIIEKKIIHRNTYHDHGHEKNIVTAYYNVHNNGPYHRENEISHIVNTAWLALNTKDALETNRPVTIYSFEEAFSDIYSGHSSKKDNKDSLVESPQSN
jgi:predicted dehydrogenase